MNVFFNVEFEFTKSEYRNSSIHLNAIDYTWDWCAKDDPSIYNALLIADFKSDINHVNKQYQIIRRMIPEKSVVDDSSPIIRTFDTQQHQINLLIHDVDFPNCIPVFDEMLDLCNQQGGSINWRHSEF